jgi:diaminopimelate epimerase
VNIPFYKYQGTGNDFVIIDNRTLLVDKEKIDVASVCDRKFGIGADGLILIQNHDDYDFEMIYFNADGTKSFCGNGSRCAVAFANKLKIISSDTAFLSTDGEHCSSLLNGLIQLQMHDVNDVEIGENYFHLNTGSPHYVVFVEDVAKVNIIELAHSVRYNARFKLKGVNVNFVEIDSENNCLKVRTYERGVEDETLSCGTGVTAVALAFHIKAKSIAGSFIQNIITPGGNLQVQFEAAENNSFKHIKLIGPATEVFNGEIPLSLIMPAPKEISS